MAKNKAKPRKALGKGIDALISRVKDDDFVDSGAGRVEKIDINAVEPNKYQPRQVFNDESLGELAASIKKHGLAQPITVIKRGEKYEIIAGERRWRAARMGGLKEIDAIVREGVDEEKQLALSLIENIQREDLNAIDEAMAYRKLVSDFGISQSELADYCGKSKSAISNALRILELDEDIKKAIQKGLISGGHARALLSIPDGERRRRAYEMIISEKWSVREVENYGRAHSPGKRTSSRKRNPEFEMIISELEKKLGTKIDIKTSSPESGKIIIDFYSTEDFNRIYGILKR